MAVNITVYDLENYPDTSKTVSVDIKQVVPLGAGGDERWVATAYTSATASGSASIQDMFIRSFKLGWCKSTGFNQGPYTINASQNTMKVAINGGTSREIVLTNQTGTVSGDAVASDMESKIRALAVTGAAEAGNLAYKNAQVEFESGKFIIKSGAASTDYTGSSKTSVSVTAGTSNDVSTHLGFYAPITSEGIAGTSVPETYLTFPYTSSSGLTSIDVSSATNFSTSDCFAITDGSNTEYRYVSSAAASTINFNAALSNDYASNSRVQALRLQDPESVPVSVFTTIDDAVTYAIASIVNQIDFS